MMSGPGCSTHSGPERSSVLFATDSFWEGVDVPGETLQMVILCRLPFRVPTEPVLKARMAAIEMRGGNPFGELSLPDAVVRLRQGFGRLMRRNDDRGVVLILDSRIVTKSYGSIFLESLPRTEKVMDRAETVTGGGCRVLCLRCLRSCRCALPEVLRLADASCAQKEGEAGTSAPASPQDLLTPD